MKKFLTILSFLTTLSSSLVVVACKTDNVDKEVKSKEDKNNQNKNLKYKKQDNRDTNNNNLTEKDNKNKEEKKEPKEEKNKSEGPEDRLGEKNHNSDKIDEEIKPDGEPRPSNPDDSFHNLGTQSKEPMELENHNNSGENSSAEQPQADESPKEEKELNNKTVEYKQKIDKLISEKDNSQIIVFFKDLYSEITQDEFNKVNSKKTTEANNKIISLFNENNSENLKSKIDNFINEVFGNDFKWNENDKKKLGELLKQTSNEQKDNVLEKIDQLFLDITGRKTNENAKNAAEEIEYLLTQKQYDEVKQKMYELVDKIEKIEKLPILNNILLLS
uniref:Lipoprotein n=1 Tax=Mycoplasma feriruminatoris TaxID=1179777 RepID=A0A654IID4_9MOLU|nr:hypothetical protein MF5295_00526 [Mycoplasma feriruminatoris]